VAEHVETFAEPPEPATPGDEALDQFGRAKGFNQWSPYVQLGFTLNL
jgi:hypothetical protein